MKSFLKANLAGYAFSFSEEAYTKLKNYTDQLQAFYRFQDGGEEVMEGIEGRIVELILEQGGWEEVVSLATVNQIIATLGMPDESKPLDDSEPAAVDEASEGVEAHFEPKGSKSRPSRRFFRDPVNRIFGGVCSGLGYYLSINPRIIRILLVVFASIDLIRFFSLIVRLVMNEFQLINHFYFSNDDVGFSLSFWAIVLYVLFWIILPEARTVEERCAMVGQSPDLSSIRPKGGNGTHPLTSFNPLNDPRIESGWSVLKLLFGAVFSGLTVIGMSLATFFFFGFNFGVGITSKELVQMSGIEHAEWVFWLIVLLFLLPGLRVLYFGLSCVFRFRQPKWRPWLIIDIAFIIVLLTAIFTGVNQVKNYRFDPYEYTSSEVPLDSLKSDTLYVDYVGLNKIKHKRTFSRSFFKGQGELTHCWSEHEKQWQFYPMIHVISSSDENAIPVVSERVITFSSIDCDKPGNSNYWSQSSDGIAVQSQSISPDCPWDGSVNQLQIIVPERVKVVVRADPNYELIPQGRFVH